MNPRPAVLDAAEARVERDALVRYLCSAGDIRTRRVAEAMLRVPRHLFVPAAEVYAAYENMALPIGHGQTISQPTVVAVMSEALSLTGRERVLEIGTGCGYQAAILSLMANEVYTIEIVPELAEQARQRLHDLAYPNVEVRRADGYLGWPEHAPYDRIILTAAPPKVPQTLFDQLVEGGILVAPVGADVWSQKLIRYRKVGGRLSSEPLEDVRFVHMVEGR